jgi:uncharacterized delta-60 repeat protein
VQPDQKVVIAGSFWQVAGVSRSRIARFHSGNRAPAAVHLSTATVAENQIIGSTVGLLSATDPDEDDAHTFALVEGEGAADNESFRIVGRSLVTAGIIDRDVREVFSIRVRAIDPGGLSVEEVFHLSTVPADGSGPVPGAVDLSFHPGAAINGAVLAAVQQRDGRWIVAGHFTTIEGAVRKRVARVNSDGTLDLTFVDPGVGQPDQFISIGALALDAQGRILIGGTFWTVGGEPRSRIARLNPDGTLDRSFGEGLSGAVGRDVNAAVHAIAVQSDGRILIGGSFTSVNGTPRQGLARLYEDGSLDPTFADGLTIEGGSIMAIRLQGADRVLIAGDFSGMNGDPRPCIARLDLEGNPDGTFTLGPAGMDGYIEALEVLDDGRIVIGGGFSQVDGKPRENIAILQVDGGLDEAFGGGAPHPRVRSLTIQPDGKIVAAGSRSTESGTLHTVSRFGPDGTLDDDFIVQLDNSALVVAAQSDGKLIVGGFFNSISGQTRYRLARLDPNGTIDPSFIQGQSGPNRPVYAVALQPDGRVILGGIFDQVDGRSNERVARLNPDGSLDIAFADNLPFISGSVGALLPQQDEKIVIGGAFSSEQGRSRIARLNANGSLDETFGHSFSGANNTVTALTLQPDGKILAGGHFTTLNGTARGLTRLLPDGQQDLAFRSPITSEHPQVEALALQADGKILIGGAFSLSVPWQTHTLARLHPDGSVDSSLSISQPVTNGRVNAVAVQSDGKIVIGGSFTTVRGTQRPRLARLYPDGRLDTTFTPPPITAIVQRLWIQDDDKILVNGGSGLFRMHREGQLDESFQLVTWLQRVNAVALAPDGDIVIGGDFTIVNGFARERIARLHAGGLPPADIGISHTIVEPGEPAGTLVATIEADDPDRAQVHLFTLVPGDGADDNALFAIEGDSLRTASALDPHQSLYRIRIRAANQHGLFITRTFVLTTSDDGFLAWAAALPEGQRGELDDPGGYRIPNLLRYAFGMDALQPERDRLPQIGEHIISEGEQPGVYLTFTYTRRTDDSSLIYIAETSDDLLAWLSFHGAEEVSDDGNSETEAVTLIDSEPIAEQNTRFLRVRVER